MPHNLVYQLIPNQHSTDFALGSYLGLHRFSCTCTMVWLGVWAYISIQSVSSQMSFRSFLSFQKEKLSLLLQFVAFLWHLQKQVWLASIWLLLQEVSVALHLTAEHHQDRTWSFPLWPQNSALGLWSQSMNFTERCVGFCSVQTHSFLIVLFHVTTGSTNCNLILEYREIVNVEMHFSTTFLWRISHSHSVVIYIFYVLFSQLICTFPHEGYLQQGTFIL